MEDLDLSGWCLPQNLMKSRGNNPKINCVLAKFRLLIMS